MSSANRLDKLTAISVCALRDDEFRKAADAYNMHFANYLNFIIKTDRKLDRRCATRTLRDLSAPWAPRKSKPTMTAAGTLAARSLFKVAPWAPKKAALVRIAQLSSAPRRLNFD